MCHIVQYIYAIVFKRIFWNNRTTETAILNAYICSQGRTRLKNRSLDRYVINGWLQTNVVKYFLCIGTANYTKASPPARRMSLFSFNIITIILSYVIIRMYIILHI